MDRGQGGSDFFSTGARGRFPPGTRTSGARPTGSGLPDHEGIGRGQKPASFTLKRHGRRRDLGGDQAFPPNRVAGPSRRRAEGRPPVVSLSWRILVGFATGISPQISGFDWPGFLLCTGRGAEMPRAVESARVVQPGAGAKRAWRGRGGPIAVVVIGATLPRCRKWGKRIRGSCSFWWAPPCRDHSSRGQPSTSICPPCSHPIVRAGRR